MKNIFILIVILGLVSSCCKEYPIPDFTAEELSWMPYKEGDTLKMKGMNGKQLWLRFSNMRESSGMGYFKENQRAFLAGCKDYSYKKLEIQGYNIFPRRHTSLSIYLNDTIEKFESYLTDKIDLRFYKTTSISNASFYVDYYNAREDSSTVSFDSIVNNQKVKIEKHRFSQSFWYSTNKDITIDSTILFDLYFSKSIGVIRINFITLKNYDYQVY